MKLIRKITSTAIAALMLATCAVGASVGTNAAAADGHTTEALTGHYATNPNNGVGKNKTITIDGDISDWDSSMLIAQGVANDDPRVYRPNSMYEIPMDDYALYAAWDDTNLYLMWEMANVQDIVAPKDDYPLTQGNHWINNMPLFIALDTNTGKYSDGTMTTGSTIWDSGISFATHVDTLIAYSTNGSNGPFIYQTGDDGKFNYDTVIERDETGIKMKWGNATISKTLWGVNGGYGTHNNRVPGDTLLDSSDWVDFYAKGHKKSMDMFYEMSIPLAKIGLTKASLEQKGIGVIKISTFGTSGMDCLPYDPSMSDNADKPYSRQEFNSYEKEDEDVITVPLARIAKISDADSTPSDPSLLVGDVDQNGVIGINDATLIQKHCAKMITLTGNGLLAADVDGNGNVGIGDATYIQKYCAHMISQFPAQK